MSRDWSGLLSEERFRPHSQPRTPEDGRNEFEDDYTRAVSNSAVRRLQDKAQVFPLDNNDFVRTRLTHSVETSAIGRSIGSSVEQLLAKQGNTSIGGKASAILATTGLVHDLGNPPFGHFGERTIQQFFRKFFLKDSLGLTKAEQADFENFEGNAQTFRLLTKLQYLIDEYGLNLSFGTLASLLKYPCSSVTGNKKGKGPSLKKFGYFQSEKGRFELIDCKTGLNGKRHPLAYLLEAADDIAYSAADIEDGMKKGVLNCDIIRATLKKHSVSEELIGFLDKYLADVHQDYSDRNEIAIQRFRIKAQGVMISESVRAFMDNYQQIMDGTFNEELLEASSAGNLRAALKSLAYDHIFVDKTILARELIGERVISGLLELLVEAVLSDRRNDASTREGKIFHMISRNYRFLCKTYPSKIIGGGPSPYDLLLLTTDFVCGMTDSYALDLYRKFTGISL